MFQPQLPAPPTREQKLRPTTAQATPDSMMQHNSKTHQGPLVSALIEMTCFPPPTYTHLKSLPTTLAHGKLALVQTFTFGVSRTACFHPSGPSSLQNTNPSLVSFPPWSLPVTRCGAILQRQLSRSPCGSLSISRGDAAPGPGSPRRAPVLDQLHLLSRAGQTLTLV